MCWIAPNKSSQRRENTLAARAVLFALEAQDAERFLACEDNDEVIELVEEVEGRRDLDSLFEFDKSWDTLHRCFTDGDLAFVNGDFPLSHVILGGVPLHEGDDYVVRWRGDRAPDAARTRPLAGDGGIAGRRADAHHACTGPFATFCRCNPWTGISAPARRRGAMPRSIRYLRTSVRNLLRLAWLILCFVGI
ncbi:DUF1877 family protein [Streptomyces sp. NPDC056704]|uniref:DUF1877 family protein n=1 Tax=Streptomyces TaxID=1883 RepID=UPI0036AA9603